MFLFQIWSLVSEPDVNKPTSLSQGYHKMPLSCASVNSLICLWNRICFHGACPYKHINIEHTAGKLALLQTEYWCLPFPAFLLDTNSSLTTCDSAVPVVAGRA